jgi:crotonobetainyl-CoA:carnitine CoA-transferase CaiB-like acyl-CoA transferase
VFDLLRGTRVLDLTTVLLGPYATQILGDFGADVIKVESPAGDLLRYADSARSAGMSAAYLNCNRNKRSIALDLTKPGGMQSLRRLIETADVFVHNMRPKTARKLGIAYEEVRRCREDIVYCYACGFGQEGRLADEPAYDDVMQAVSGLAYLNAEPDGEPRYMPNTVCDKVGGLHLAIAILAGLASRNQSGAGVCIEAPMFESMVSFLFVELLAGRTFEPPLGGIGYHRLTTPFRRPFRTKDGYASIIPYSAAHWQRFLKLVGRPDLIDDENVTDPRKRSRNIESLYRLIAEVAPRHTTAEWLRLLRDEGIPCGEVNRAEDLLKHPHLEDVGLFGAVEHPTEGPVLSIRSPFTVEDGERGEDRQAPRLGGQGREILREAGFAAADIDRLERSGALRLPHD